MLARRLPVGGAATFAAPAVRDLGQSAFWNTLSSPRAAYYNGRTHLAWTDDAGDIYAAHYDHASDTLSTPDLLVSGQTAVDGATHVSPAVIVRASDRRVVVANVANGGTNFPGVWISTNPEESSFPAGESVGSAGAVYTYTTLAETVDGMYLFVGYWSGGTRHLAYFKSTDDGDTWTATPQQLLSPASGTAFFWRISHNADRCDIYATSTDRSSPASVYHFIFEGDVLKESDGSSIAGSLPRPATDGTLVQNGSLGTCDTATATYDAGDPCAALYIDTGSSVLIRRAVWTGSAWAVDTVVDTGGEVGGNPNVNGAAIADVDTFYVPVEVSGRFEMFRYTYAGSWSGQALTSGSAEDHAFPEAPLDAAAGLRVLWGFGTYTDDSTFDFAIYGYGLPS